MTIKFGTDLDAVQEAESYRWQKTNPPAMTSSPTGEQETFTYNGAFSECKAFGQAAAAGGSNLMQVTAVVERIGGMMAKLTVTKTYYDGYTPPDPDDPGTGEPTAGQTGSDASNPQYDWAIIANKTSILLHPTVLAAGIDPKSAQGIALKMLSQGADETATFTTGTKASPVPWTVGEALASVDDAVVALVASQSEFFDPSMELTVTYTIDGTQPAPEVGSYMTITAPEGNVSAGGDRNWLLTGGGVQIVNGQTKMVKKYLLSAPGGWNAAAYPS